MIDEKLVADYAFDCNFGEAYAIFPFLYLQADYAFGCNFVEASTNKGEVSKLYDEHVWKVQTGKVKLQQACKGDRVPTCMIPNAAMCSPFHICPGSMALIPLFS
ncbi:hypothetical protein CUMW_131660 [Citrus unshiu]|uniref:Uncharacterized protein n=1 Tax=Citrus unshiu TaxID=55188 RepID=A0A2H5PFF0_CITUN|nr:hypothetical protein CUMW_131660 [Citrus unshiu]